MADIDIRSLATILADPNVLVPPLAVVPGFAWKERLTVLAAREKFGKSTLAAYAAARVTNCEAFADGQTLGPTVLWASAEEHEADIAQRAVEFLTAETNLYILTDRGEDGLSVLGDAVAQVKPELVVVDALESWCEGAFRDANSSAELGIVMSSLRRIAHRGGPAMWVQHHANRSDGSYRGSSAIGAGCDVLIEMFADDSDSTLRLFKPRGRIRGLKPFTMKFDGNAYRLHGGELSLDARAIAYVQAEPGISMTKLREKLGGSHGSADRVIRELLARGILVDEPTSGGHHRIRLPGQAGLRLDLETSPESASSTPDAGFLEAGSPNLPVPETPGEAGSVPPAGAGDAWEKPAA